MKLVLIACVVALLITASAEFPYPITESTGDSVTFEFDCESNKECMEPGELYCGNKLVDRMTCESGTICKVRCEPVYPRGVNEWWEYVRFTVSPMERKTGELIEIELTDSRDGTPLVWNLEVHYGGGWELQDVFGPIHIAANKWAIGTYQGEEYVNGEKIISDQTNRQGMFTFTPDKPGLYVIRTTRKWFSFIVGDADGNVMTCKNDICETDLGEDEDICPEDCPGDEQPIAPPPPPPPTCGDGTCDSGEEIDCPADCAEEPECTLEGFSNPEPCCEGLSRVDAYMVNANGECVVLRSDSPGPCINCGDGACGLGEDACNCPDDCAADVTPTAAPAQGGDMTWLIILLLLVIVAVVALIILKVNKQKGTKAPQAKEEPKPEVKATPGVCAKCGTKVSGDSAFCAKCGARI